jgi:hypothetical protein
MRFCLYRWLESRDETLGYEALGSNTESGGASDGTSGGASDHRSWLRADMVVIENQPALKNPGMKSMACAIFDYFMLRLCVATTRDPLVQPVVQPATIKFVSAMKKTKVVLPNSIMYVEPPDEATLAEWAPMVKYKQTKARGIWLCRRIMAKLGIDPTHFEAHTKQDDMADAFLQALTVLPVQVLPVEERSVEEPTSPSPSSSPKPRRTPSKGRPPRPLITCVDIE